MKGFAKKGKVRGGTIIEQREGEQKKRIRGHNW